MTATLPEIPATMTAIEILEPGGPEMLAPATRPVELPGMGEVLVKVAAALRFFADIPYRHAKRAQSLSG